MHVVHRWRCNDWQPASVNALAFNASGTRLAVVRGNGDIELWENFASSATSDNKSDREEISKYLAKHPISQNPVTLAAALSFPNITQWHCYHTIMGNGQPLVTSIYWTCVDKVANPLLSDAELARERLFTTSLTGQLIEWDVQTYLPVQSVDSYGGPVWCSSLSPSNAQIALGCHDGSIRIFDISQVGSAPIYLKALQKHRRRVTCIDWLQHSHIAPPAHGRQSVAVKSKNPNVSNSSTIVDSSAWWDTPLIISGSEDGHIHVWNTNTCSIMSVIKTDLVRQQASQKKALEKQAQLKDLEANLQDGDYMDLGDDDEDDEEDLMEDIGFVPGSKEADLFGKVKNKPVIKQAQSTKRVRSNNGLVAVRWIDSETAVASDSKGQVHFINCRMGNIQDTVVLHQKLGVATSIVVIPSSMHTRSVQHAFNQTYQNKYAYQRLFHSDNSSDTPSIGVTYPYLYLGGATGRVLQYVATPRSEEAKKLFFGHECKWMENGAHHVHTHDVSTLAMACISSNKVSVDKPLLLASGGLDTGLVFYSAAPSTSDMAGNKKTGLLNNTNTSFQFLRPTRVSSLPPRQTVFNSQYAARTTKAPVPANYPVYNTLHPIGNIMANLNRHKKLISLAPLSANGNLPQVLCSNRLLRVLNKLYSNNPRNGDRSAGKELYAALADAYPNAAPTRDLLGQLLAQSPLAELVARNAPKAPRIATFDGFEVNVYTLGNSQDKDSYLSCRSQKNALVPTESYDDQVSTLTSLVSNQGLMNVDVASVAMNVIKVGKLTPYTATSTTPAAPMKPITEDESASEEAHSDIDTNKKDAAPALQPSILHRVLSATTHSSNKDRDQDDEEDDDSKSVDVLSVTHLRKEGVKDDGRELGLTAPHLKLASIGLSSKMRLQSGALAPNGHIVAVSDSVKIRLFGLQTSLVNIPKEDSHDDEVVLSENVAVRKCAFPPMPPSHILKDSLLEYQLSCVAHILGHCGAVEFAFSKDSSMLAVSVAGLSVDCYEYTNLLRTNKRVPIANSFKNAVYLIDLNTYQVVNVFSNDKVLNLDSWLTGVEGQKDDAAKKTSKSNDESSDSEEEKKDAEADVWSLEGSDIGSNSSIARHLSFSACGGYLMSTDDQSIVRVYSLVNNSLVCTLPVLPHPVTAAELLPVPVLSSQGTFVGTNFFNLASICRTLFKDDTVEESQLNANTKKGRASALFATKSKPTKNDEGSAASTTDNSTPQQTVVKNLVNGLKGLQQTATPTLTSPAVFGCLADGSFFIFDTATKAFITSNCLDNPSALPNSSFAPLPFPSKLVDVVSTVRASDSMSAKLSQKERVIKINVSQQPLARRLKISLPASIVGNKTKNLFVQAYIPCVSIMLQANSFTFHLELPATCLMPQLIPQALRVATQNALKRKDGAAAPKLSFAAMISSASKFTPKMKAKIIQRFKPLLAMGYADPVYGTVAGATLEYFKDTNERPDELNQNVMVPAPQVVVVEASWLNILSKLPEQVYKKKYGQM